MMILSFVSMTGLEKMLHNICISAVAISLRWASHGPWASCCFVRYTSKQHSLVLVKFPHILWSCNDILIFRDRSQKLNADPAFVHYACLILCRWIISTQLPAYHYHVLELYSTTVVSNCWGLQCQPQKRGSLWWCDIDCDYICNFTLLCMSLFSIAILAKLYRSHDRLVFEWHHSSIGHGVQPYSTGFLYFFHRTYV